MSGYWWQAGCQSPDKVTEAAAWDRQAQLTKPTGALGELETAAVQLASLQRTVRPRIDHVWITVFAGDHGVVEEGVSAYPQAVTVEMVRNFVSGGAAISTLGRGLGANLEVIDLGTATPYATLPNVRRIDLGPGTSNFAKTSAMTEIQCDAALDVGRDSVRRARAQGAHLYIGGEMGIGNTTAASALGCALLDVGAERLVGRGTGLDDEGLERKRAVIQRALSLHATAGSPYQQLCRLGGFEIAALAGAYVACAQQGLPAIVDGFISSVAALCAVRMNAAVRPWLLFGHRGAEPGHEAVLEALSAQPLLNLGMRLGEGSGAALAVPLLQQACVLHAEMATFAEAAVSNRRP
ncbi:nicotinate-nucleotide--dimethylbenzimidazole phosphoribosyltransferase [Pseudomonas sp. Marseille-QA0892]